MSLSELLYGIPYKLLTELRSVRIERLTKEREEMENDAKNKERERIRNKIIM